jgi:hypothetical protein
VGVKTAGICWQTETTATQQLAVVTHLLWPTAAHAAKVCGVSGGAPEDEDEGESENSTCVKRLSH